MKGSLSIKTTMRTAGLFLTVLALSACVKQRPGIDSQTANINDAFRIAPVQQGAGGTQIAAMGGFTLPGVTGKGCSVTTKSTLQPVRTSEAGRIQIDELVSTFGDDGSRSSIRFLNIVDYDSNCELLNNPYVKEAIEFRGEENTTYPMVFHVTQNYVTVYKLATEEQISHLEVPYSRFDHGYWYVPVGGWTASFYRAELARNADNRETNQRIRVPVRNSDFHTATHVDVDPVKFQKFNEIAKVDLLPRDFFEGEWYFSETVVNTRYQSGHIPGGVHGRFDSAPRIKFLIEQGNLFGLNVNIDEELVNADNHLNFPGAIKIPAKLRDFRRARGGVDYALSEEEHPLRRFEDANFLSLEFLRVETPSTLLAAGEGIIAQVFSSIQSITVMKDLIISDGFLSFTVEDNRISAENRFTFMRAAEDRPYTRRQFFIDDLRTFGYFTAEKSQIQDHRTERLEDVESRISVARFNPNHDVVFHFSNITPGGPNDPERAENLWVRDVGREAINLWNQAFIKAGVPTRIRLDESQDVALGDIRYNILNLIGENVGSIIGYGPSLAEPWTGEIISATSNTFLSGIREGTISYIRDYISRETQRYYDFTRPDQLGSTVDRPVSQREEVLNRLSFVLKNRLVETVRDQRGLALGVKPIDFPQYLSASRPELVMKPIITDEEINGLEIFNPLQPSRPYRLTGGFEEIYDLYYKMNQSDRSFLFERNIEFNTAGRPNREFLVKYIQNNCPAVMAYIEQVNSSGERSDTESENAIVLPCSRTFEALSALSTTVHEIGHNLGLRHNFIGSADQDNYLHHSEFEFNYLNIPEDMVVTNSSSIMDYVPSVSGIQITPGGYDVAALRFGYGSKVELPGAEVPGLGRTIEVPNNMALRTFLNSNDVQVRNYQFCTDEDAYLLQNNVFCDLHDVGTSAVEIATHWINNFYDAIERRSYRYDRVSAIELSGAEYNTVFVLKRIYEQWRMYVSQHMNRRAGGERGRYLDGVTLAEYQKVVGEMLQDPEMGETYRDFLAARNLIFNFYLDVSLMPNRYCVTQHQELGLKLMELEQIRTDLQESGVRAEIRSCSHREVEQYLARRDLSLVDETGHFLKPGIYSLNPNDLMNITRPDFGGTELIRMLSFLNLVDRRPMSIANAINGYIPGFMDEPDTRALTELAVRSRVVNGVNWNGAGFEPNKYAVSRLLAPNDFTESRRIMSQNPQQVAGLPNFESESDMLRMQYLLMISGMNSPSTEPNETRITPYLANRASAVRLQEILNNPATAGQIAEYVVFNDSLALFTSPQNTFATQLIRLYKQLSASLAVEGIDLNIFPAIKQTTEQLGLYSAADKVEFGDVLRILIELDGALTQLQGSGVPAAVINEFASVYGIENQVFQFIMNSGELAKYGIESQEDFNALVQYAAARTQGSEEAPGLVENSGDQVPATVMDVLRRGLVEVEVDPGLPLVEGDSVSDVVPSLDAKIEAVQGARNAQFDQALAMDLTGLYQQNNLPLPSKEGIAARIENRAQTVRVQQLDNQYNRNEKTAQMRLITQFLMDLAGSSN